MHLFAHLEAGTKWALIKIFCSLLLQEPTIPTSLSSKKNTVQEKQVAPASGKTQWLPSFPSAPCALLHSFPPSSFPSLSQAHIVNAIRAPREYPGTFSCWPETQKEEQQLVLLIQQISVQPEFQRSLMRKGRWGQFWVESQ